MYSTKSMQISVNKILKEGMIFEYTYDFGSSTELIIKVVSANDSPNDNNILSPEMILLYLLVMHVSKQ